MKLQQLPMGARFEYQGEVMVKAGPLTATKESGGVCLIPRYAVLKPLDPVAPVSTRQHSSGGKSTLLGISKRGDVCLRTLLIHGGRSVIRVAERQANYANNWLAKLRGRRNKNVVAVAVAVANKNARTVRAILALDREYDPHYVQVA